MTAQPGADLRSSGGRCRLRLPMSSDDEAPQWCQRPAGHLAGCHPVPDEQLAAAEPWPLPYRVWRGTRSFRFRWGITPSLNLREPS